MSYSPRPALIATVSRIWEGEFLPFGAVTFPAIDETAVETLRKMHADPRNEVTLSGALQDALRNFYAGQGR